MAYELRIAGRADSQFDRLEQAESRAREVLLGNADADVAIIDLATGKPYAPAADAAERERLARKIGF